MEYLKIKNLGVMEPMALTLMGASTKAGDSSKIGMFGSVVFVGFLAGSLIGGVLCDKYGRKNPFLIASLMVTQALSNEN